MSVREQMSAVDTAWLRMDSPSNLMMICGVVLLQDRLDFARFVDLVGQRFLRYSRFRSRVVQLPATAMWEVDAEFDIERHVVRASLAGAAGREALQALASRLIATPLDPARPMWQFHVVENYGSGSAIVMRIHHCYADGIALIQVMLSMTDADRKGKPAGAWKSRTARTFDPGSLDSMLAPVSGLLRFASRWGAAIVEKGGEVLADPAKAVTLAEQGGAFASEVMKLVTMGEDSRTRLKGKPRVAKHVTWTDPIPLSEVKAVGHAFACSVNDVLLSSVAGAIGGYLGSHGDRTDGLMIRAAVPVNLRPLDKAYRLGNRFGIVFLDLPIGIENPIERLYQVRANMQALKDSWQPVLALALLAALGAGPKLIQDQILSALSRNATAVMTNVPGPQQTLYFAGAKIDGLMFWVPQSGDIGIGVSILSYDGKVQFGLVADRRLCPDPERLISRFRSEFEKLLYVGLLVPWQQPLTPEGAEAAIRLAPSRGAPERSAPARGRPPRSGSRTEAKARATKSKLRERSSSEDVRAASSGDEDLPQEIHAGAPMTRSRRAAPTD